jgi:hypothetical protein
MSRNYDRFKDAPWFKPLTILVGGLGGIGSNLVYLLAKMPYEIYIFDFDTVEEHNSCQMLGGSSNIGKLKTEAVRELAVRLSDNYNVIDIGEYKPDSMTDNIVFAGFDNMKTRRFMYDNWKAHQLAKTEEYKKDNPKEVNLFVDMRLAAETGIIYFIDNEDKMNRYETELFDDSEVPDEPCTFRATAHASMMIASYAVAGLTNKVTNVEWEMIARDVPFKFNFEIPLFNITCTP